MTRPPQTSPVAAAVPAAAAELHDVAVEVALPPEEKVDDAKDIQAGTARVRNAPPDPTSRDAGITERRSIALSVVK